jgi:hypothetical protein
VNSFGVQFHHFGLAVRSPERAFAYLRALGYSDGEAIYDPLQKVNLALCRHSEMPDVELIWPADGPSPLDNLIRRGGGSMIYHLCYTTRDPAASIVAMEAAGLEVMPVSPPQPAVLFGGREVSFFSILDVGMIELIHEPHECSAGAGSQSEVGR